MKTTPFLKWAGGKQAMLSSLIPLFPKQFNRFFEPFVGGGSVFLSLGIHNAAIGDANDWLMDCYEAIRDDVDGVMAELDQLQNTKEAFLEIRKHHHDSIQSLQRKAAYFIYLNKTCFRGLFRVNQKGFFNVPYGAYDRRFYDPALLREVATALLQVEVRRGDFEANLAGVEEGDFVYMDPPYYKLGGTSDFNRYTADQFRKEEHIRLAAVCRELDQSGVKWAVSNSKTALVEQLYTGFQFHVMNARREINLDSASRNIQEYLITNY